MSSERPPVCDYDGSNYQTEFWEKGGREYEDQVEAVALERLLPEGGRLLLEVGAGAGRNTLRYKGFERIVLLDYSITQLQQARARLGTGKRFIYVAADAYRLPFVPGLFDTATMIRTLHHMSHAAVAISQVRQVLRPGATFIMEYANKRNLKAVARYLLRRQTWNPFTLEPVEFARLNYDFHPLAVRAWLESSGFSIQRQLTVSHFRIGFFKRMFPLALLVKMDSVVQMTGNWWQLSPSVFIQSQAVGDTPTAAEGEFFRCPQCGSSQLENSDEALICASCKHVWPVRDGIYHFRD